MQTELITGGSLGESSSSVAGVEIGHTLPIGRPRQVAINSSVATLACLLRSVSWEMQYHISGKSRRLSGKRRPIDIFYC